jgi:hypothetical protein
MLLVLQFTLHAFEKWEFYLVGPIKPLTNRLETRCIIIVIDHLTRWDEAEPVRDCDTKTIGIFFFQNVVTRFGCMRILMSYQGNIFLNRMVSTLTEEFQIHH